LKVGARCLSEPASRRLDGEIYCAFHKLCDWNPLSNRNFELARESGQVFVEHYPSAELVWIDVPPFTSELKHLAKDSNSDRAALIEFGVSSTRNEQRIGMAASIEW
jgi:hypothetical protein